MFFCFEQKTAYKMLRSLVGSEICIRNSADPTKPTTKIAGPGYDEQLKEHVFSGCAKATSKVSPTNPDGPLTLTGLLYTTDAADEDGS